MLLDAYAVDGLQAEQIRFLHAPEYLNPTYEYGVTFERGTAVEYGDRKQIFMFIGIYQKMLHRFLHSLSVTVYESYLRFL